LKCKTWKYSYIGQTGRFVAVRYWEHIRYVKTNNQSSAHVLHILNSIYEYGSMEDTVELLKTCAKGTKMNCWESLFIQTYQQQVLFIEEQRVNDFNPIYALANITGWYQDDVT
jgi:hypothetical protein